MGEGDLQRLGQPSDAHAAHTQAHQAIVQHAATVLQAELGALEREVGEAGLQEGAVPSQPWEGVPGSL